MPIAHVCPSCGIQLARIRAVPDAVYGLPIVVCPGCSLAAVRRRHPLAQLWRSWLRLFASIRALALGLLGAFVGTYLLAGMIHTVAGEWGSLKPTGLAVAVLHADWAWLSRFWNMFSADGWIPLAMVAPLATVGGLWVTWGLGHWRRGAAWTLWLGAVTVFLAFIPLFEGLLAAGASGGPGIGTRVGQIRDGVLIAPLALVMALPGVPLGQLALAGVRRGASARFRKRLARLRRGKRT